MSAPDEVFARTLAATGHPGIAHDEAYAAVIPEDERCEWCQGTGNEFYAMYRRCPQCFGSGLSRDTETEETT